MYYKAVIIFFLLGFNSIIMTLTKFRKSYISKRLLFGKEVYIKRDELLNINGLSGNKARKLYELSQTYPFPRNIISYGGAQSNTLAAIANLKNRIKPSTRFLYFTKKIPTFLKNNPTGSYASALKLGTVVIIIDFCNIC